MEEKLNKIVKSIIYKCRNKGILINNAISYLLIETKINNKTNHYHIEENYEFFDENIFIEEIEDLLNNNYTKFNYITLEMLVRYKIELFEFEYLQKKELEDISNKTAVMIDDIVNVKNDSNNNYEVINKLYKKIFNLLHYKNNNIHKIDTKENTLNKEINAAMESIIPRASFDPFLLLSNIDKINQINELVNIIIGIRLFNKNLGKGGFGLKNINELINVNYEEKINFIDNHIQNEIFNSEKLLDLLKEKDYNDISIKKEILFLKSFIYISSLIYENLENLKYNKVINETKFNKEIESLKTLLGNKSSAPKEKVYPKFINLSKSYHSLIHDLNIFNDKIKLFEILMKYRESYNTKKRDINSAVTKESKPFEQNDFKYSLEDFEKKGIKYIYPDVNLEFMETKIDYSGHCIHKLSKYKILVTGNPKFGIFIYNQKNLVFSDIESINSFYENPYNHLVESNKIIKNNIIIKFLLEEEKLDELNCFKEVINGKKGTLKMLNDQSVSTPIHFRDSYIDHNYYWNEWEMRKKAIQMANIRNMKTISCQTNDSIFKIQNETQVNLPKDKETMTGINKGNNPIWPRNYIVGLRNKLI